VTKEDHGYVVGFGIDNIKGFIKNSDLNGQSLQVGSCFVCCVKDFSTTTSLAKVTLETKYMNEQALSANGGIDIEKLLPGNLVNVKVADVLENGVCVSFLGVFGGSIPSVHLALGTKLEDSKKLKKGDKFKCRILYSDHNNKQFCLTRNSKFLHWDLVSFPPDIKYGNVDDKMQVIKLDERLGVWVKIRNSCVGYVHISKLSDKRVENVGKKFEIGQIVTGRVIGFDYCDGIVLVSLQNSVINQKFMALSDIKAGMEIKGQISRIEGFGLIVAVSDQINGLCPSLHLSDAKLKNPEKLFKVGKSSTFKVLLVNVEQKKLILTHKKALITMSQQPILDYEKTKPGDVTYGVITALKNFGSIVTFFNDVRALCPLTEMSYDGKAPDLDNFWVGQTVKCQVLTVDPIDQKLRVTFRVSDSFSSEMESVGYIGPCQMISCSKDNIVIKFEGSAIQAVCSIYDLNDHLGLSEKLFAKLKELKSKKPVNMGLAMITAIDSRKGVNTATLKPMCIEYAKENCFVKSFRDLHEDDIIPAVINGITDTMCFVKIGSLSAVSSIHNLSDGFVSDGKEFVKIGQTVLVKVIKIENDTGRVFVTLKNSQLSSNQDMSTEELKYLDGIFQTRKLISSVSGQPDSKKWVANYLIGSVVIGKVDQVLPYGVSVSLGSKVSGLISTNDKSFQKGDDVKCQILDVDTVSKIVDLKVITKEKLLDEKQMLQNAKKVIESQVVDRNDTKPINGTVFVAKEDYAIICIESLGGAVSFCLNRSINSSIAPMPRFRVGQKLQFFISNVKEYEKDVVRILLQPVQISSPIKVADTRRMLKNSVDPDIHSLDDLIPGHIITAKVQSVKDTQINIRIADNLRGRIHVSEVFDNFEEISSKKFPLKEFKHGQSVQCKVIGFHSIKSHAFLPITHQNSISSIAVELSIRKSILDEEAYDPKILNRYTIDSVILGEEYLGFITKIEQSGVWIQIGHQLMGKIDALHLSKDLKVLSDIQNHFSVGEALKCTLILIDKEKNQCNFSVLRDFIRPEKLQVNDTVIGRVVKVDAVKGLNVYLGMGVFGKLPITEVSKEFKSNPFSSFKPGQYESFNAVKIEYGKIDLSLRSTTDVEIFEANQIVKGYVTSISDKGCFVALRFNAHARVKIAELSDSFVKEWKSLVKLGQLVTGKIKSVNKADNQIELSLKQSEVDPNVRKIDFEDLKVKTIVGGTVKKIEKFGVFIQIDDSNIRGLCHITEVSENPVKEIEKLYEVGDRVQAFILRIDLENRKVSLSLKSSYFEYSDEDNEGEKEKNDLSNHSVEHALPEMEVDCISCDVGEAYVEPLTLEGFSWNADLSIPADNVPEFSSDNEEDQTESHKRKSKKSSKKDKEEEERLIAAKELSLLDKDAEPEMPEDFERLLLGSPDNSFLWIKYMAYQLELAEVDKARRVAERALSTINYRQEQERLNVLIAYLNLENQFGNETSQKLIFDKACQMSDPKKVYMQTTQIYERSGNSMVL
jgi:rRNA biogenesis protein RRP5